MTDEKQLSFIPEVEAEFDLHVPLGDITPDEYIIAAPPSRQMIDSIRELGVFQPVVLYVNTSSDPWKYNIEAGRRRVMASRAVGKTDIKAIIYPDEGSVRASRIGVAENAVRSANILSDLENIKRLKTQFPDMDLSTNEGLNQLCRLTGMQYSVAKARVKSLTLPAAFAVAVFQNRFPASKLETVAKLNKSTRDSLAARLEAGEKLRSSDVVEAKANQVAASMAQQPTLDGFDNFFVGDGVIGFYATHDGDGTVVITKGDDDIAWLKISSSTWWNDPQKVIDLVNFLKMVGDGEDEETLISFADATFDYEVCDAALAQDDSA